MQPYFENWKDFLKEQDDLNKNESVILYHISDTPNIKVLDPAIAAKSPKSYTKAEYRTWDRPRVFFFTKWGQKDTGIGRIAGSDGNVYKVEIKAHELYPVMRDPLKLSRRIDDYKEIREKEKGLPKYYPTNPFEVVATLGEREHGFKGFIYPQSGDPENMIVTLWKSVPVQKIEKSFYDEEK